MKILRGLLSHDKGKTYQTITSSFEQAGYTIQKSVLNAWDYGVPQKRERLITVGIRNDLVKKIHYGSVVHRVYVEMKNKHNTMNSAAAGKTFIKMQSQLLKDEGCACFLVEAIAKKSQNIKWETSVDNQKVGHKLIRRVSMDKFYALVTGQDDAFYQICMVLLEVIQKVVETEGENLVPHDTVIDELREIAKESSIEGTDLAFAMAIYMLGFSSYEGFNSMLTPEIVKDMQTSDRISTYVKMILKNSYGTDNK